MLAQIQLRDQLDCIEEQKSELHRSGPELHRRIVGLLTARYAHQSAAFGGNKLTLEDALMIEDQLLRLDISSVNSLSKLSAQPLPSPSSLLPRKAPSQVIALRNMVLLTQYVAQNAMRNPAGPGISLGEIKLLAKILFADTKNASVEYRGTETWLEEDQTRIFPEVSEVPALVARFCRWQTAMNNNLHTLIQAAHLSAYFLHIRPFHDYNVRLTRLLMADFLIRRGYLPIVYHDVESEEYLQLVSRAQDGYAKPFCRAVVNTQHDLLLDLIR